MKLETLLSAAPQKAATNRETHLDVARLFSLERDAVQSPGESLSSHPDAVWRIAGLLSGNPGKHAAVSDIPEFRWLLAAVGLLRTRSGTQKVSPDAGDENIAGMALRIVSDSRIRTILEAALLAPDGTPKRVADEMGLDAEVVTCFADLFFNIPDRREEGVFVHRVARDRQAGSPEAARLMTVALRSDVSTVLAAAGFPGQQRNGYESGKEAMQLIAQTIGDARVAVAAGELHGQQTSAALQQVFRLPEVHRPQSDTASTHSISILSDSIGETLALAAKQVKEEFQMRAMAEELRSAQEAEAGNEAKTIDT